MSSQELLIYSLLTGFSLFFLINPTFKMAPAKQTPERIRSIRVCSLAMAGFGIYMMIRFFI